ncbi:MAG: S8 family serine peptidase [Candidatus Aenigmatarchaeota archaeon]
MVYKKYIRRNGKLVGPYYYASVRGEDGRVRSVYLGRSPVALRPGETSAQADRRSKRTERGSVALHETNMGGEKGMRVSAAKAQPHKYYAELGVLFAVALLGLFLFTYGSDMTGLAAGRGGPEIEPAVLAELDEKGEARVIVMLRETRDMDFGRLMRISGGIEGALEERRQHVRAAQERVLSELVLEEQAIAEGNASAPSETTPEPIANESLMEVPLPAFIENAASENASEQYLPQIPALENLTSATAAPAEPALSATGAATARREPDFRLKRRYSLTAGFSGMLTPSGLEKLRNNPAVERIVVDRPMEVFLQNTVPLINADDVWQKQIGGINVTGAGQTVCIIDTGIDYNHPDLGGCFGSGCKVLDGYDYVNDDNDPTDDNGHGTHVAGIVAANGGIKGVAPGAKLVALKAFNSAGQGWTSDIVASIDWCRNNATAYNITVISMSFGGGLYTAPCDSNPDVIAAHGAVAAGIMAVAATGNDASSTAIASPACGSNVTAVGATTKGDDVAGYSNTNGLTDMLAPGGAMGGPVNSTCLGGGWCSKYGTSMATPHVSGAAALMQQYQKLYSNVKLTPREVEALLQRTGVPITDPDNGLTFSRIDVLAAVDDILAVNVSANSAEKPGNGSITFDTTTNMSGVSAAFTIRNNSMSLNSSAWPQFNKSATLKLYALPFQKQPVVLKNGAVCGPPQCNITSYADGTLTFRVAGFTNYSAGSNSYLTVWNSADSGMPFYSGVPTTNENVSFYANYTNRTSGTPISDASCQINFTDGSAGMAYNSTKGVFEYARTFSTSGLKDYNITCNHSAYETLATTDSIQILTNSSNCTWPGPNVDWNITGNDVVVCVKEDIVLTNQSINVLDNATFRLEHSTLTMNASVANTYNIVTGPETTIVVDGSVIRSLNSSITFKLNVSGSANITYANLTNGPVAYFYGVRTHFATRTLFAEDAWFFENSTNIIDSSSFSRRFFVFGGTTNRIYSTSFFNYTRFYDSSNNTIINSTFTNVTRFFGSARSEIANSTLNVTLIGGSAAVNFTEDSSIASDLQITPLGWPTIGGYVNMPPAVSLFLADANVSRFYPIRVVVNGTSLPKAGVVVNITNAAGELVSNGTTNATGWVVLNVTLNATNYGIGNFTVSANPSQPIGLLTDTPIILQSPDTDAPSVTLLSPPNNSLTSDNDYIEFEYTVSDATSEIANCSFYWNGALNQTATDIIEGISQYFWMDGGGVPDGAYNWSVSCYDSSAEANQGNSSVWWLYVDTTPPLAAYVSPPTPANGTYLSQNWINVTVNTSDFIHNYTVFRLYNASGSVNSTALSTPANGTYSVNWSGLADGSYWFNVTAHDMVGFSNSTETRSVVLDATPPAIVLVWPAPGSYLRGAAIEINGTASDANPGSVWTNDSRWAVNSGSYASWRFVNTSGVADGAYAVNITANDSAGNWNSTTASFTVDNTNPTVDFVDPTPADNSYINVSMFAINVSHTEANPDTIILYINGTANESRGYSGSFTNFTKTLADGVYTYYVWLNDSASNANQTATRTVTVDTQAPTSTLVSPGDGSWSNSSSVSFNCSASDAAPNLANITLWANFSGTWQANGTAVVSGAANWSVFARTLGDGTYAWNCLACDLANNCAFAAANWTASVDTTKPLIAFAAPTEDNSTKFSRDWAAANVSVTEANLANVTYRLFDASGALVNATTFALPQAINWTNLTDGVYYYNATAVDVAGNANSTETRVITLDTALPQIWFNPSTTAAGVANQNWIFVNITVIEASLDSVLLEWNGTNESFDNNLGQLWWENKSSLAYGNYTIRAWANDTAGNTNSTELRVVRLNAPPSWSAVPTPWSWAEDTVNNTLNLSAYSSDADGDDLNWSASATVSITVSIDNFTGIVTLTPAANWSGSEVVTFTAWDPFGASSASNAVTLNVTPVNDPPYLFAAVTDVSFPEDSWNASTNMSYHFRDIDNATLFWNWTANDTNVSVTFVGDFANISAAANWFGAANLTLIASDGEWAVNDTIVVTVTPVNDPPIVNLPATISFDEDTSYWFNLSDYVTDVDDADDEINWSASAAANLTIAISNATKIANITPSANWSGWRLVTFTARDPAGGTGNDTVNVTVTPINDPPYLKASIPDQSRTSAGSWQIDLDDYFGDPDGDDLNWTYSLSISSGSISVDVSNATGVVTFSSSTSSEGTILFWAWDPVGENASSNLVGITVSIAPPGGGGGGGGGGPPPACQENWTCSAWSECLPNGTRTRMCTDLNSCGTIFSRPTVVEACAYYNYTNATNVTNVTATPAAEEREEREGEIWPPSCFDGWMNGDETGVDCGGSCPPCPTPPIELPKPPGQQPIMVLITPEPVCADNWMLVTAAVVLVGLYGLAVGRYRDEKKRFISGKPALYKALAEALGAAALTAISYMFLCATGLLYAAVAALLIAMLLLTMYRGNRRR